MTVCTQAFQYAKVEEKVAWEGKIEEDWYLETTKSKSPIISELEFDDLSKVTVF